MNQDVPIGHDVVHLPMQTMGVAQGYEGRSERWHDLIRERVSGGSFAV